MRNKTFSIIITVLVFLSFSCIRHKANDPGSWGLGTSSGVLGNFSQEGFNELKSSGILFLELSSAALLRKSPEERVLWVDSVRRFADASGIAIWSVHLPFSRTLDVSLPDDTLRQKMIDVCTGIIEVCAPLNVRKFIIHPSSEPISDSVREERIANSIASLKVLNQVVKKHNARMAIECLPRTCLGNTSDELIRIVRAVGEEAEICFDTNHLLQEKPEELAYKAGSLITTVHISDYDGLDERHWLPGKGIINWNKVIDGLVKGGFKGPFMYELTKAGNPGLTPQMIAGNWQSLLDDYKAELKK